MPNRPSKFRVRNRVLLIFYCIQNIFKQRRRGKRKLKRVYGSGRRSYDVVICIGKSPGSASRYAAAHTQTNTAPELQHKHSKIIHTTDKLSRERKGHTRTRVPLSHLHAFMHTSEHGNVIGWVSPLLSALQHGVPIGGNTNVDTFLPSVLLPAYAGSDGPVRGLRRVTRRNKKP